MSDNSKAAGVVGYAMIGLSYCLFGAASWPMIPYVVDDHVVATGYGLAFTCENIGCIIGPVIVGWISDTYKTEEGTDYFWVNVFLGSGAALGLLMNIILLFVDKKDGGVLMAANAAKK